jgi:hypothetical protein
MTWISIGHISMVEVADGKFGFEEFPILQRKYSFPIAQSDSECDIQNDSQTHHRLYQAKRHSSGGEWWAHNPQVG